MSLFTENREMALIEAEHLHKTFGAVRAVDGLSLSVAAGEIYGLVGPDGAGKTTAIRLLCGALHPNREHTGPEGAPGDRARIRIAGFDLDRQVELARAQIGYLPQRFSLYEDLTVLENIRFFAEVRGLPPAEWRPRCLEILEFVGLADFTGRRAGHLSGGMKQKLGLAAALVHRPRVLLLDEPTTGVDPVTRQDFWQLIIRLVAGGDPSAGHNPERSAPGLVASGDPSAGHYLERSAPGVAVLVSTPYMDEAARCGRVGFMQAGRLLVEGTPGELRARLAGQIVELRGRPLPLLRSLAAADPAVEDVQMFGDRLHLRTQAGEAEMVIARLGERIRQAGGEYNRLRPVPVQLEDVFIALVEV